MIESSQAGGTHLIILEPGQALSGQHEPVLLGPALHDADVVDGQPALADDLSEGQRVRNIKFKKKKKKKL